MKMKYFSLLLLLASFTFVSCTDKYEQQYKNYDAFSKINIRNKGWFPDIISGDAFNLKSTSYLDSLCAFGVFSYSDNKFYDSIFTDTTSIKIDFFSFEKKVNAHKKRIPVWFLKFDDVSKNNYQVIKRNSFSILRQVDNKNIYFILSEE